MKVCLVLLGFTACAFAQYDTQPSGYGNNNPAAVQYVAKKSPRSKPVDYTKTSEDTPVRRPTPYQPPQPTYNVIGNKFSQQNLGQANTQGQSSAQIGGAQTNVGLNQNAVNVGQTNNQNVGGGGSGSYRPSYDAPSYGAGAGGAIIIPVLPSYAGAGGSNVIGNKIDSQTLGQVNTQGQGNYQQGGAQTNVGANANTVNVGQQNYQGGGGGGGSGYRPSYDAPSYGAGAGAGYGGGPIYIPDFNNFIKNNVYSQNLGQTNTQGQANYQQGGNQANVGVNTNEVNVGQTNNQNVGGGKASYDAPRYGGYQPTYGGYQPPYGGYQPSTNVIGNKFNQQNLGQTNQQGQQNYQKGGDQTNVGANVNTVNVGQTNTQNVGGKSRGYDAPKYKPAPEPENPYRHRN
ncbi:hypothetical protein RB195_002928 [Necator americanus]|uniref:Uncharacterized protein n=1 Tax=Necator americanus TaxID=51031 RepID=A0ABR1DM03_NECAM